MKWLGRMFKLTFLLVIAWLLVVFGKWAIIDATFFGTSRADCGANGACWAFITARVDQFVFGFYPAAERWRPIVALTLPAIIVILFRRNLWRGLIGIIAILPLCALLLYGGIFGLSVVDSAQFGGLILTLAISVVGLTLSLPLGIALALGRRSNLPIVRKVSVAFIELWRGVPLITVLFMGSVMLPLFLPESLPIDKFLRALIAIVLFASAYMAEVVRGGLQSLPTGQSEAAFALGLSRRQSLRYIVLPQALRTVIPGIVNTFVGLIKDTSLVLIIGMFDLLGIIQAASTDPLWLGSAIEGYLFAGMVFFCLCFSLSRISKQLEIRQYRQQQHAILTRSGL